MNINPRKLGRSYQQKKEPRPDESSLRGSSRASLDGRGNYFPCGREGGGLGESLRPASTGFFCKGFSSSLE